MSILISVYWYFLVAGHDWLLAILPVAYFLFGLAASQWITAHLKYLPRVCNQEKQALHVSVHSAVIGIIGGLAPIIWGYLVKLPGGLPGVQTDRFALFFLCLLAMQLVLLLYVPRLTSEHRERPAIQTNAGLLRPFRYVGQLVNPIPEQRNHKQN